MTILATNNRISYIADGVLTGFTYSFKVFAGTDLQVFVNGVLKTITTDYLVTGVGGDAGGQVVFLSPPPNGQTVLIVRVLPLTQGTDLPSNDKFPSTSVEDALDKLTMLIQQLDEVDKRALKLAITSAFSNIAVPDPSVGKYLRWKSTSELENADIASSGSIGIPVTVAAGGTGLTAVGTEGRLLTSVGGGLAYGPDGRIRLVNKAGSTASVGQVVVTDPSNDAAFVNTTSAGLVRQVAVVDASILNNATGYLRARGGSADDPVTLNVQGNVTRGNYLRTSATSGRAEDAGSSIVDGVFGIALTGYAGGGAGTVQALLFGVTLGAAGSKPSFILTPSGAILPTSGFPELVPTGGANFTFDYLGFDQSSIESAFWHIAVPTGAVFTSMAVDLYYMATPTTGVVRWRVSHLSRADSEAFDVVLTETVAQDSAVPGTASQVRKVTITGFNVSTWAAGEIQVIRIDREANHANDTLAADALFLRAVVRLS